MDPALESFSSAGRGPRNSNHSQSYIRLMLGLFCPVIPYQGGPCKNQLILGPAPHQEQYTVRYVSPLDHEV
ncbi:hypothetical protein HanIR_Chr15g0769861 [Helianthus annuus]|nr:hypothetical protein HanIR_Chr15g0769861 [Helianthus annuus]